MAKMSPVVIGLLVFAALGVFGVWNPLGFPTFSAAPQATPAGNDGGQPATVTTLSGCGTAPAITYSVVDRYAGTIKSSGITTNIRVNGAVPITSYATGAGTDQIELLATNRSLFIAPVSKTVKGSSTVGCDAATYQATSVDNSTGGHVYSISDPTTLTVLTNQYLAAGANNFTIGSGGSATGNIYLKAPSRQGVAPFGYVACVEASQTVYSQSDTGLSLPGATAVSSRPARISAGAGNFVKCYESSFDLSDNAVLSGTLAVTAISGQNPATGNTVKVHIVPKLWFKDTDSMGTYKLGTENKDQTDVSFNDYVYTIDVN